MCHTVTPRSLGCYRYHCSTSLANCRLQGALGRSHTLMLACVSPGNRMAPYSMSTLKYAQAALSIASKSIVASSTLHVPVDPMDGDIEDPDGSLDRRAVFLQTGYSSVFARCVGDPNDPLILYVHGSGPDNSSLFWNCFVLDVAQHACGERYEYPSMKAGAASYSRGTHRPRVAEGSDLMSPVNGADSEGPMCASDISLFDRVDSEDEEGDLVAQLESLVVASSALS